MTPIFRQMFRGQSRPGRSDSCAAGFAALQPELQKRIERGQLLTTSVFRWGEQFFFYSECIANPLEPVDLYGAAGDVLLHWPGAEEDRRFIPLIDIFHCVEPQDLEHWRRRTAPQRIFARLARLKPEMVSSYIFYHYQLQEERPGSFDKYCLIGIHENLLFFYLEHPFVVEPPPLPGKLRTNHTPDHWQDVMDPHFDPWMDAPDGQEIWRDIETIFTLNAG